MATSGAPEANVICSSSSDSAKVATAGAAECRGAGNRLNTDDNDKANDDDNPFFLFLLARARLITDEQNNTQPVILSLCFASHPILVSPRLSLLLGVT